MLDIATPQFTTERLVAAPRPLVWSAFTEAEHLKHWWGPKGFTVVQCTIDLRPGGVFHYGLRSPQGQMIWGKWVFREIVAPERLTYVSTFSDEAMGVTRHPMAPSWPLEMFNETTLAAEGNNTRMRVSVEPTNATEEERQTFAAGRESMRQGFGGTFDKLDAYLARL